MIPDLIAADKPVRELIYNQAAARLDGQCAFAASQDSRTTTLISASASLAAAAAGLAIGAAAVDRHAISWGAGIATVGFVIASGLALFSLRSRGFHPKGWYPHDFRQDLEDRKTIDHLEAELIEDLEGRLRDNARALVQRGRFFNAAATTIILTPLAALIFGILFA